jgi:hypothetical protein
MHVSTLGHFIPQMAGLIWLSSFWLLNFWSGTYIQRECMHLQLKLYAFMLKALKLAFKLLPLILMFAKHLSMNHFNSSLRHRPMLFLFEREWLRMKPEEIYLRHRLHIQHNTFCLYWNVNTVQIFNILYSNISLNVNCQPLLRYGL